MQQYTCQCSLLLIPLTLMSMVGDSYAVLYSKSVSNNEKRCAHVRNMRQTYDKNVTAVYRNLMTESAAKNKSANREISWQNLLTKNKSADDQKLCRLDGSTFLLKTLHHTSKPMAGAHIPSVKFNACWLCSWAGPSRETQASTQKSKGELNSEAGGWESNSLSHLSSH
jgi:hypothetical protein